MNENSKRYFESYDSHPALTSDEDKAWKKSFVENMTREEAWNLLVIAANHGAGRYSGSGFIKAARMFRGSVKINNLAIMISGSGNSVTVTEKIPSWMK